MHPIGLLICAAVLALVAPASAKVEWEAHFDRNALLDVQPAGATLVALTASGHLLAFDAEARHQSDLLVSPPAVCLGRSKAGAVFVAQLDGAITRLTATPAMALAPVARVPGRPLWIDSDPRSSHLLVAVWIGKPGEVGGSYRIFEIDPARGGDLPVESGVEYAPGSAHLVDRAGRVWSGVDRGEWGGQIAMTNLATGEEKAAEQTQAGVYGFVERPDGQVWAYGGMMHLGMTTAFIARVDGGEGDERKLWSAQSMGTAGEDPQLPVTWARTLANGNLQVLRWRDLYEVTPDLKSWRRLGRIDARHRFGRPDAVGSYPAINAVRTDPRRPERLVLATGRDGLKTWTTAGTRGHALEGQLGAGRVTRLANTAAGLLALQHREEDPPWRLGTGGWEALEPFPSAEPSADSRWYQYRLLVMQGGAPRVLAASNASPGVRVTLRWDGRAFATEATEESNLNVRAAFNTSDDTLWVAWYGALRRFDGRRWQEVGREPGVGWGLEVVSHGPPWTLFDREKHRLWQLRTRGGQPALVKSPGPEHVRAAIQWSEQSVLLATPEGLLLLDAQTGETRPAPLAAPPAPVEAMTRDARGRLWVAAGGLYIVGSETAREVEACRC